MNKLRNFVQQRAVELEAKLDVQLFGVRRDPATGEFVNEDGSPATAGSFKTVAGAAKAAGAGLAIGGGVLGAKAVASRYGADRVTSPSKAAVAVGRGVARDVSGAAKAGARAGLMPLAGGLDNMAGRASRASRVAADSSKKGRGLRKTLGLLGRSVLRPVGFAEKVKSRLIELAEK